MSDTQDKNTLKNPQSVKPFQDRIPPKNPQFGPNFKRPNLGPKFNTAFRTQNRGGK